MDDLISRKAAIDDIETVNPSMPLSVNWVKNWVKTLPSAQPDITEDDVKEFCKKRCWIVVTSDLYDEMIQRWSSVQPEQKTGKWIIVGDNRGLHAECSYCGEWRYHLNQKFCGECGSYNGAESAVAITE